MSALSPALLLGLLVGLLCLPASAEVLPRISADEIYVNTPFSVTFDISGAGGEPDLAPLSDDFAVVGSARSSHLALDGGRIQRRQQLTLTLTPLREGELELPSLQFGSESSRAITLTVRGQDAMPSDGARILLEVSIEPEEVYVQEQVVVSVQVVRPRGVDLDSARLSDPSVSGGDAIIEALGKDRAFTAERDGEQVEIIERRFAVVPQSSGELVLEPLLLDARRVSGALSLSNPFGVQIQPIQLRSPPQRIRVKAAPAVPDGQRWLPAKSLTLTEAWSGLDEAGRARTGEPIVRTVGILADGLTAAQLPELAHEAPQGVNQYGEPANLATQRNREGLSAQRTERLVLIPTRDGVVALPGIRLTWWNLATGAFETASLPGREIEVLPAVGTRNVPAHDGAAGAAEGPDTGEGEGQPDLPQEEATDEPASSGEPALHSTMPDTAGGLRLTERLTWLATGLIAGVLLMQVARRFGYATRAEANGATAAAAHPGSANARLALTRVMQAAGRNDAPLTQRVLLELAPMLPAFRHRASPVRNLAELAAGLGEGPLREAVLELQRYRYGQPSTGEEWSGRALGEALQVIRLEEEVLSSQPQGRNRLPPFKPQARIL